MNFKNIKILPFVLIIKLYQYFVSPLLKTNCRYLPTCSEYMILCLREYGLIKGFYLGFKRLFSCHPYGGEGYDPVPKKIRKEF